MKTIIVIILLLVSVACIKQKSEEVAELREYVGKVVSTEVIPTSFNESMKMMVKTDKGFYVISGITSFNVGEEVIIINGKIKSHLVIR